MKMSEIQRSLEQLDPAFRTPFTMHHEGYKYHEIAEHLGIPIGTVKSRIFQARQRLMEMLTDKNVHRLMPHAIVIGSGFAGTGRSSFAGPQRLRGNGRGEERRTWWPRPGLADKGFTFDMGPSFYWMPEVFERFFADFGERVSDHYQLTRLDPSYSVVFGPQEKWMLARGPHRIASLLREQGKRCRRTVGPLPCGGQTEV